MDSDDVAAKLAEKNTGFELLLSEDLKEDLLVLTLKVLTNLCRANFTEIVTNVLSRACAPKFIQCLENFLLRLTCESNAQKQSNKMYWKDVSGFWKNLIEFLRRVIDLLPNKARDELCGVLEKANFSITIIESCQGYTIDQSIKDSISNMQKELKEEVNKLRDEKAMRNEVESSCGKQPPQNFRELSIVPKVADLHNNEPFIRPNKDRGAYDSVEHYLDVQFRLMREDFIGTLRSGVQEYLGEPVKYKNTELRIYRKVFIRGPQVVEKKVGILVSFGVLPGINWNASKRFLYGALLCFTRDNVENVLFATVAHRDEKCLACGEVIIEPCFQSIITNDMYNYEFVMFETKVYYEPYNHVLHTLCSMSEDNFPMKRYIVDVQARATPPQYLSADATYKFKGIQIPLMDEEQWPSASSLQLDKSQFEAYMSALIQEFAVIQGPPGTGKTYIALQIAGTLLKNIESWRKQGPLVVVCYTNHALDQFLEGILKYTKSVVRVGGRSKNEALENYTLHNMRKIYKTRGFESLPGWQLKSDYQDEMDTVLREINETHRILNVLGTNRVIVGPKLLREYCRDTKLQAFPNVEVLLYWLMKDHVMALNEVQNWMVNFPQSKFHLTAEQHERYFEDEDEKSNSMDSYIIFDLGVIDIMIVVFEKEVTALEVERQKNEYDHEFMVFDPMIDLVERLQSLHTLQINLQGRMLQHPLLQERNHYVQDEHWRRYWRWVMESRRELQARLEALHLKYDRLSKQLDQAKQIADVQVMRDCLVVGVTTTGAARLHTSLRALKAPIVLVEEAAEVMESHIISSLTKDCKHVILIGDHKQLRPNAAVYKLGTKYNLNISLFERMINVRGDCPQLAVQRRMRPEIARLICPSIYETLHNHESVEQYPSVNGVDKNLFFINHNHSEVHRNEESWENPHEAKFLVHFAKYLILQGYKTDEITILCTYTGQLFALKKESEHHLLIRDVRITTVDNYQGEENRIILLSLVRNNNEGRIGFLKAENRVCVALSRAREGFYIMGNMQDLTMGNSIWPKIEKELEEQQGISFYLPLRCQIHSDQMTMIKDADDFAKCPEGGCLRMCNTELPCSHICPKVCHIQDRQHEEKNCTKPCIIRCPNDHPCPLQCREGCKPCEVLVERELKCGHVGPVPCHMDPEEYLCIIKVDTVLPHCEHTVVKPCCMDPAKYPCSYDCEARLECGHTCIKKCHATVDPDHLEYKCRKDCSKKSLRCQKNHPCKQRCYEQCKPCDVHVGKLRSCEHFYETHCSQDVEAFDCERRCKRTMDCGHKCKLLCNKTCGDCAEKVEKTIPDCGHKIGIKCSEEATRTKCKAQCQRTLECGHRCRGKCKDPCRRCEVMVLSHNTVALCGHKLAIPCFATIAGSKLNDEELMRYCREPCRVKLACDHLCSGTCGTCKQGRIHAPCAQQCGNNLICGHKCEVPCRASCPPCRKPCPVKCEHNKCKKKCGEPCTPCREPCGWGCVHSKCSKLCFELCDREPCNIPCPRRLKCRHPCIGFCGEPCPKLCRFCHSVKLTEFFLGNEDEPDARFVLLPDCGHCIESNGLLQWLSVESSIVGVKVCPRCKTAITKHMRYINYIKREADDVQVIKAKVFGERKRLKNNQKNVVADIEEMIINCSMYRPAMAELVCFLDRLHDMARPVTSKNRRQTLSLQEADTVSIVIKLSLEILNRVRKVRDWKHAGWLRVQNQVRFIVASLPTRGQISEQEIKDIQSELSRLHYMVELCNIEATSIFKENKNETEIALVHHDVSKKLHNITRFTELTKGELVEQLQKLQGSLKVKLVTVEERRAIVKAIGLGKGHWNKCPNGHFYAIGDCGGAMQVGKCIECGARVGGTHHALLPDNSLAPEIDGATRSAWS